MTEIRYAPGDVVFSEGDPSNSVCRIVGGEVEIVRGLGDRTVVLGRIGRGDFVGEMGVIEGKSRSATVHAVGELTVELFGRDEFLERISRDNVLALQLLQRMSERLNAMNEAFSDLAVSDRGNDDLNASVDRVVVLAASDTLAPQMPDAGMVVNNFPFAVGRLPTKREPMPSERIDLRIDDSPPFRMSRSHFRVEKLGDGFAIRDLGSTLGTLVDGTPIGHHFASDIAHIRTGPNLIVAGGTDSPFIFRVMVGHN